MSNKSVTARMTCQKNEPMLYAGQDTPNNYNVELRAMYDAGGNEAWSKATPWGETKMSITNPGAYEFFEPGEVYEMEFYKMIKQEDGSYKREG